MERRTAVSKVGLSPATPNAIAATAGPPLWLLVIQSTPAITDARVPDPAQLSTLTATRRTPLATPYTVPPTVPATAVPCPKQSELTPSPVVLVPHTALPAKSLWVIPI